MPAFFNELSITYGITVSSHKCRSVSRIAESASASGRSANGAGKAGGFSLRAGVSTKKGRRKNLERLCCDVSRSAMALLKLPVKVKNSVYSSYTYSSGRPTGIDIVGSAVIEIKFYSR